MNASVNKKSKFSKFILFFIYGAFIFLFSQTPVFSQTPPSVPEVDVEVGPEFSAGDKVQSGFCMATSIGTKFPFDLFVANIPEPDDSNCPHLEIFEEEIYMCELIDIWGFVKPGAIISLLIYAVMSL